MDDTLPATRDDRPTAALAPGTLVGRYRVTHYLARGGMGEVYAAVDTLLDTKVALKFIHPKLAADAALRDCLRREVRLAQSVTHPCVARTFTLDQVDDQLFVVMELLEGPTLAERLRNGPLTPEVALPILGAVLDALGAAHDRGVIHRDVKPGNIVLCEDGRIALMDFGVAQPVRGESGDGLVGTPGYIAPEVIVGQRATFASDLYAVGVIAYEMLAGKRLFKATSTAELMTKHVTEPVPPDLASLCRIPVFMAETLEQLLAKSPASRPASAKEARAGLVDARPKTRYARNGPYHLAYQLVGTGGLHVIHLPGRVSHLEEQWNHPEIARWLTRLAASCRLILTDRRGLGMSDPAPSMPTLAERVDDLIAVLDAAGVKDAVVLGIASGGPMAIQFAVTHPERTRGLVLCNTYPRLLRAPDWSWGPRDEDADAVMDRLFNTWGSGMSTASLAPSRANDTDFVTRMGRLERASATPGQASAVFRENLRLDVRDLLPRVRAPSMIIHRTGDRIAPVESARYMAAHLRNATLIELPGNDHLFCVGDTDAIVTEIEAFLARLR